MRGRLLMALALVGAAPAEPLVLAGDGLSVGAKTVKFDRATRAQAIALVTTALGAPIKQGSHGDCATDTIVTYAQFKGAFELSFRRGRLSGWTADRSGLKTSRGIAVGATLAAVKRAYPDVDTIASEEDSGGLGASFQREGGPYGWIEGTRPASRVTGLWAGATCIVS